MKGARQRSRRRPSAPPSGTLAPRDRPDAPGRRRTAPGARRASPLPACPCGRGDACAAPGTRPHRPPTAAPWDRRPAVGPAVRLMARTFDRRKRSGHAVGTSRPGSIEHRQRHRGTCHPGGRSRLARHSAPSIAPGTHRSMYARIHAWNHRKGPRAACPSEAATVRPCRRIPASRHAGSVRPVSDSGQCPPI